jgi:serine/threonine protein kinase
MSNPPDSPSTIRWPQTGEVICHGQNRYLIGEALGRGSYGATYACTDQWSNSLVVKVLIPNRQTYEQVRLNWHREIHSLLTLRHPNITYVHDAFELAHTFHIVMERCGGSVSSLFTLPDFDGYDWVLPIARCMLQAIGYMHEHGYVHKDIHLRNLFWTYVRNELVPGDHDSSQSVTFKIGDLGVSRLEHEIRNYRATVPWMVAPEVLDSPRFGLVGRQTDIYHAGLVLLAVVLGIEPSFTAEEILRGVPRATAEQLQPPFGPAIGLALRQQVDQRIPTAFEFWRTLSLR